ncbi:G-type lectin S-receptor-like serine/threonine-protein kinase [Dichanthelium oligosanthes]|uniref:Receptor-like serine/threonine-protein kinase n=1 Tax=Dichanthelium oligosanthes TaxID=888268 RepID=A0A1E5VIT8_9POAL|nr:G-type lectin S-receptor-like serine/threonine-protein kinase [Dichanthelium oligosanthes]
MAAASTALLLLLVVAIHGRVWCFASDTISVNSSISGGRTVVSRGGNFELGFFSPAGNSNRSYYVGIWYKKAVSQCTPVWVANRAAPVSDPASSQLAVAADGNLVLINEAGKPVWSSDVSSASSSNTVVAAILDSGNLVLRREDGEVLWQSSEHPTDTWLPGVHLGLNKITGHAQALTSWKISGAPAPGMFTFGIDPNGTNQFFMNWNRTVNFWSSGEWNGDIFPGVPELTSHDKNDFEFVSNANSSYFTYSLQDPTVISRLVMDVSGQVRQKMWLPSAGQWTIIWTEPHKLCDVYAVCGAFGVCNEKSEPFCICPAGFRPSSEGDWELGDHSHGCRRNNPLQCDRSTNSSVHDMDDGDAFLLAPGISLPRNPSPAQASSAQDCRLACSRSCDCTAYSYGSRCALWYGDLLNLQRRVEDTAGMDDLYLRLSAMDVPSKGRRRTIVFVSVASVASILALSVIVCVLRIFRRRQRSIAFLQAASEGGNLVAYEYSDLRRATKNFSEKLGGGSFGSVYKGTLPHGGADVAVKKLEGLLCVGEKQFRNEVRTIGVIQHVNLVRLCGFSSRGGERLLVYEYMPNGSLDRALFGGAAAPALSWRARFQIALGAARGLLYLHEGCRDCIIHCDIKPENILLDEGLVPKVADFGMAKLVGREFSRVLTTVRGTIGYLAPEWISGLPITAKVDVYSYGMVLMEIISGRRNARCWEADEEGRMSEYFPLVAARKVTSEGEALVGLLDERLNGDADEQELDRACRVACWCVQDDEARRPTMEQVVQMLEGVVTVDVPPIPASLHALSQNTGFVSMHTTAYFDGLSRSL